MQEVARHRIDELTKVIAEIYNRPVPVALFGFSSFLELLGIKNTMDNINKTADTLDTILLWATYILTGIIFYLAPGDRKSD